MKAGGMGRRVVVLPLAAAVAWLASGCVWGVVRDAETGQPIAGAEVAYWNSDHYNIRTTTTDANGIYVIDPISGIPATPGDVIFFVRGPNSEALQEMHVVDYGDNPNASQADPSSFWEVQSFDLTPKPGFYTDEIQGFSMTFPRDWRIEPELPMTTQISSEWSSLRALPAIFKGGVSPQCVIASDRLEAGQTPETSWAFASFPNSKVVQRRDSVIAGRQAVTVFYEQTDPDPSQTVDGAAFLFQRGDQAWAIDCFTDYSHILLDQPTFTAIAKSFEFTR